MTSWSLFKLGKKPARDKKVIFFCSFYFKFQAQKHVVDVHFQIECWCYRRYVGSNPLIIQLESSPSVFLPAKSWIWSKLGEIFENWGNNFPLGKVKPVKLQGTKLSSTKWNELIQKHISITVSFEKICNSKSYHVFPSKYFK